MTTMSKPSLALSTNSLIFCNRMESNLNSKCAGPTPCSLDYVICTFRFVMRFSIRSRRRQYTSTICSRKVPPVHLRQFQLDSQLKSSHLLQLRVDNKPHNRLAQLQMLGINQPMRLALIKLRLRSNNRHWRGLETTICYSVLMTKAG